MQPTIVIAGRPNVGKSTLFNRLVGRRDAIVNDQPGVTRDRREGDASLGDLRFRAVDTAGLEDAFDDSLPARMRRQTEVAIGDADLVLLVIDARAGVTPVDEHFAKWLRTLSVPVLLLANKCEGRAAEPGTYEAYSLGLGDPVPVSAEHGGGMNMLYDAISEVLADRGVPDDLSEAEIEQGPLRLAIVGRPNVGKSTLVNALIGDERLLTGPEAGVTRDAITVEWEYQGQRIALVDTAGLRRKARIHEKLEQLSVGDALNAIQYAEVVALVLDGEQMLERQDLTIGRHVIEEGRALLLVINKWDIVADKPAAMAALRDRLQTSLPQVAGVTVVTLSALTGKNLEALMPAVLKAYEVWNQRVPTAGLNSWLADVIERHPPPLAANKRRIRLRYVTQPKARPPTFAVFGNRPEDLPDSYVRYLENSLRDRFDLAGTPIRINMRKGKNPYGDKKTK
ncbi:MAG: ribosome biogenesis GTPase Der [Alphaproteobacteria bacterium]|nr:ribosome biogenesis GTPase Der [Alphaproteobacteria bacterium]